MGRKDWRKTLIDRGATLGEAVRALESGSLQICLVVDGEGRLVGTVTDGDVRRALLAGRALESPVAGVMKTQPLTWPADGDPVALLQIMSEREIRQVPLLDDQGRVVDLTLREDLLSPGPLPNWVVLMAGGQGIRLKPITDGRPKPLVVVGDKPLMENILEAFIGHQFRNFYISVNYMADKIRDHFGDGSNWGVRVRYLEETEKLGTAGALGLLPGRPEHPLIVMNGDVLTKVDFRNLLDYHNRRKATATVCIREYDFQVPFGVVRLDGDLITGIDEKPVQSYFVNAGIYVLDPQVLDHVEPGSPLDMPTLLERLMADGLSVAAFPVREYWVDIGQMDDLWRAMIEHKEMFP